MKALVLAAGKSTRIAPVSAGLPKPLFPIAGQPVIARTLAWLAEFGVTDVCINLHYRPEAIREALGDGARLGVRIHYSLEPEILGTAGAFRALASRWTGTTLVVYGDNLMRFDIEAFVAQHARRALPASVALFDPTRHPNSGVAGGRVLIGATGLVDSFSEGGASQEGFVNAGVYLLEPAIVDAIGAGFQDFARDVFPTLVKSRQLNGHVMESGGYCLGLDTPKSVRAAEQILEARQVVLT